jgi:hypothetical protein
LTGRKVFNTKENRCQRCVERKIKDCTITNTEVSYARPTSPKPHQTPSGSISIPLLPEPAQSDKSPVISEMKQLVPAPSEVIGVSPGSEHPSQTSQASNFWKTLFEEDASVRKRVREDSPQGENKKQGSKLISYFVVAGLMNRHLLWKQSHGSILCTGVCQCKC